ncbi:MAG: PaaI family thioesterase [Hyphomicrobiaceae bacterium]|nr:PaaI family thioesterase [Hyphomicrobiaceae bacterium]
MDETAARRAFEDALASSKPEFETFFLSRLLGLTYHYEAETLTVEFPIHDFLFNPQGWVHGGVSAFVLDVTMGHLLWHTLGASGSTLELKTQYVAPLRGARARCVANFIRKGNGISFLEARLYDEQGTVTVAATSTWRVNRPREARS